MSKSGDLPVDEFARRRAIFIDELRDLNACAILHAAPEHMRNMAVNFGYRQDSDFIYLSGWSQANAILLLTPKADDTEAAEVTLFVSPRNPKYEVWTGPKKGLDEARELPGIDQIFDSDDFFEKYQKLITGYERLVVSYGNDAEFQAELNSSMEKSRQHPSIIQEASSLIKFHRLIKSESEIQAIEKAIHITGESLKEVFPQIPNLSFEYEVRAEIERGFTKRGAVRLGFLSIVGAGKNATYLHYEEYTGKIEQGDLILMDVGAEWNYYSADISRTVPINGVFNAEQAIIYQLVLDAQTAGIESIKPGVAFREPHNIAVEIVTQGLVELGLLDGDPKKLIEDEAYRKFFMHGTSHWLGLDVHDAGSSVDAAGDPHILKPGMILTVEPGIYISETEDVDSKWWNIGVRIEDDVLVTAKGYRLLSASIPRSINQIEALMQP
ncbi:aminopeptidase P N-terminal domain-containing protein [bacterium]|nr:aminopeptidase P N-terminal domain-containing protein [bacterium]